MDRKYLKLIAEKFFGGPVGLETISAVLSEQKDMIEGCETLLVTTKRFY